jgi:hypothetical protein
VIVLIKQHELTEKEKQNIAKFNHYASIGVHNEFKLKKRLNILEAKYNKERQKELNEAKKQAVREFAEKLLEWDESYVIDEIHIKFLFEELYNEEL